LLDFLCELYYDARIHEHQAGITSFNTCTFENGNANEVASKFHKIRQSDIRPTIFTTLCIKFAFQKLPENRNKT